jgi:Uma2 family endonuclease
MSFAEKPGRPRMTSAEFFDWAGDGHPGKQELVSGRIRSMAPASSFHGMLQLRLSAIVEN